MDEIDIAQETTERNLAHAIRKAQTAAAEAKPRGRCLFCEEAIWKGWRWCDSQCRDDWEKERAAARDPRNIVAEDDDQ